MKWHSGIHRGKMTCWWYLRVDATCSSFLGTCFWFWWKLSVHGVMPCNWSRRPTRSRVSVSTCWHGSGKLPSIVRSWRSCVRAPLLMPRRNWKHRYSQPFVDGAVRRPVRTIYFPQNCHNEPWDRFFFIDKWSRNKNNESTT